MSLHIQSHVNPLYEWVSVGFYLHNQAQLESGLAKNMEQLQSIDAGASKACFDGILAGLADAFDFDAQTSAFWFAPLREEPFDENCLAFLFGFMSPSALHAFLDDLNTQNDEAVQALLCQKLSEHLDLEPMQTSVTGILEALDQDGSYSAQAKWHVAMLLQLGKKKLVPFLEEMQRQQSVVEALYATYHPEIAAFVRKLEEWNQDASFLKKDIGIELDEREQWNVIPSLFRFNSISMHQTLVAPRACQLYFGWKIVSLMALAKAGEDEAALLLPQLKAIADRSKLELLHLLSTQRMYGSQLAEKMQLSGATISYHMNQLVLAKLVVIQKVENRIYYEANGEQIQFLLAHLERFLLPYTK